MEQDRLQKEYENINQDSLARKRIRRLFDQDSFVELDSFAKVDSRYAGVVTGYGTILGEGVYVFSQDIDVDSGAVDMLHARKIEKIYRLAMETGCPVVGIYDSNGARLEDMPEAMHAYGMVQKGAYSVSGIVPHISVVVGSCGGSSAVIAASADIIIMSEKAEFFLNSPRIINADNEHLEGAGSIKGAVKHGVAHLSGKDDMEAIDKARHVITYLPQNNLDMPALSEYLEPTKKAKEHLFTLASDVENMDFREIQKGVLDHESFFELSEKYGENAHVGFATMQGSVVFAIGVDGEMGEDECNKVAYYVNLANSYSIPILTFLNSEGFSTDKQEEMAGLIRHTAKLGYAYSQSTTQKISIITGRAYGSFYTTLAGKGSGSDIVLSWPNAIISPLFPTTAVAFIAADRITSEKSRQQVEKEFKENDASPFRFAAEGQIDRIIDPRTTREELEHSLGLLEGKRINLMPKKQGIMPL